MAARTLISVEECLETCYRPDCDYVDGEVVERNLGEWDYSSLQSRILVYLWSHYHEDGIRCVTEQRVQFAKACFRIPDVASSSPIRASKISPSPLFTCIEVLSLKDRMSRIGKRVAEFLEMGVSCVWVLDPKTKQAYTATPAEGLHEIKTDVLKTKNPTFEIPLSEIFA